MLLLSISNENHGRKKFSIEYILIFQVLFMVCCTLNSFMFGNLWPKLSILANVNLNLEICFNCGPMACRLQLRDARIRNFLLIRKLGPELLNFGIWYPNCHLSIEVRYWLIGLHCQRWSNVGFWMPKLKVWEIQFCKLKKCGALVQFTLYSIGSEVLEISWIYLAHGLRHALRRHTTFDPFYYYIHSILVVKWYLQQGDI